MATAISSKSKLSDFFHNKSFMLSFHRLHRHRHSKSELAINVSHTRTDLKTSYSDELREVFRYFDADGDGKISGCDLRSHLVSIGEFMPPEEAQALIVDLDAAGGDTLILEYDDFVKLMEREGGDDDLKRAFDMFVSERREKGSGCVTQEGLQGSGFIAQESLKGSGFIAQEGLQGSGCDTQEGLQGSGFIAQEGLKGSGCVTQEALQFKQEGLQGLQGSGYITADGLQKIFCHLGYEVSIEECKAIIVVYDRDGDGVLGFSDFQQMMA